MENEEEFESYPLIDALDHEILMHRDAHFGGKFPIMLEYYEQEGKGSQADFNKERILRLAELEQQMNQNIAALFLTANEMQKVADAREAYQKLRSLYEGKTSKNSIPRLIADLILTEDEEAAQEIESIAAEKERIVPALIDLLRDENFYDPLFPGYGQSPALAVKCLERIGDKRAIISLFESIGRSDFFSDDQILKALVAIGDPAKEFLLRVLKARPLNEDNERAAIALIAFRNDPEVASTCLEQLKKSEVQKDLCLSTYLVLACEGLTQQRDRDEFVTMSANEGVPKQLREDMKGIIRGWNQKTNKVQRKI